MNILLKRKPSANGCTHGDLFIDDFWECFSLEDVVREAKIPGKTAIPAGKYRVVITYSQRFQKPLALLLDVPGFTGIRIHAGNTSDHTEGCILVGRQRSLMNNNMILDSRVAVKQLQEKIQIAINAGEEVWLEVIDGQT